MGAHEAPQWLLSAFVRSVIALGATASREEIEASGRTLMKRWCTEDRHHHDVTHLVAVLERVDTLAQETHNPEVVRVAAWYHGAVFDTRQTGGWRIAGENKPASAVLAREQLLELGVPERTAQRVHDLVMNLTRHDADPGDVDAMALCDADLGTLAVDPQRYKAYRNHVRAEYQHVPVREYLEGRIAIVSHLLARRNIFTSPLASAWEEPARQNLTAELVRLKAELATLPPRAEGAPSAGSAPEPEPGSLPGRAPASRFGREPAETTTLPMVAAVAPAPVATLTDDAGRPVPSMVPVTPPSSSTPSLPEEDVAAEVVGVPFEDRRSVAARGQEPITSAMERVPQSFRDVPRREAAPATPAAASPSAPTPSAATPTSPSAASPAAPSTGPVDDLESTGTLFRPPGR